MNKKTVKDIDLKGKRVLMRVDFNVPMQDGKVTDDKRIKASLPTIKYVLDQGASLILMSHLGRPKGGPDPEFSLRAAAEVLSSHLGVPVKMAPDTVGPEVEAMAKELKPGEVLMLENTRFHKGEEKNDLELAKKMAALGDVYVNDAFGSAHRAHSSTEGVAQFLPAVSGFLMEQELEYLGRAVGNPEHPYIAILGGAKISDKILVVETLLKQADKLIIGGGMANTFLAAQGVGIGKSLAELDLVGTAREIIAAAAAKGAEIVLPVDAVVAREFKAGAASSVVPVSAVPADAMILDVGPQSVAHLSQVLASCKTLLWNGPLGAFEIEPFGMGTFELARVAAKMTKAGALVSVAGGGDTVAALNMAGVTDDFTYVSTAGGAFLEWLEGRELPGVAALARG